MPQRQQSQWFLYIIENKLGQLYTGITTDVERRFQEHCDDPVKGAKALRGKGPLMLRFYTPLDGRSEASKAERWVKRQTAVNKRKIIDGNLSIPPMND